MKKQDKKVLNAISQIIFDKKGFNILALDVTGISSMTDYFILAEGSVNRQVKSLSNAIKNMLPQVGLTLFRSEGEKDAEWIVMDCGEVVIHLFIPEFREKYALEELWKKGKIVDVEILVSKMQEENKLQ
jgi:ribosome-associated protein